MRQLPRRTRATSLTDDELILLDVMFDGGAPFQLLRRQNFREQWNYPPHNLADDQLRETLKRFVDSGLLKAKRHHGRTYFELSPDGGQQWESERLPAWRRYATDKYGETPSGKPFVTITATTTKGRDDFWTIGCEVGMFAYSSGRIKAATIKSHVLIPWKRFPALYVVVAMLDDWRPLTDWRAFEERRTWWRTVGESDKFWPKSA